MLFAVELGKTPEGPSVQWAAIRSQAGAESDPYEEAAAERSTAVRSQSGVESDAPEVAAAV